MIKQGILNADLRSLTARIGHRDRFAIVDAGYNIPLGIETVEIINMQDYGMMNGAKVLDFALELGGK